MQPEVIDVEDFSAPDVRDYGRTLWRHRRTIALTIVVTIGLAIVLSVTASTTYQATADIIIQPSGSILPDGGQDTQGAARTVANEIAVLESQTVRDAAAQTLGHVPTISIAGNDATSDVVSITAKSSDKEQAAKDANVYAKTYTTVRRQQSDDALQAAARKIRSRLSVIEAEIPTLAKGSPELLTAQRQRTLLQQQLDQVQVSADLNEVGGARVLSAAVVPASPVSPKPIRNVAIALILGLLLGIGLAFLREFLDDKIVTREDLERASGGLPVLGQIPSVEGWRLATNQLVTLDASPAEEGAAEAYRTLRASLQFLRIDQGAKTIQITSPESAEGKSITVANTAVAFARAGHQVAVICCDLRRPRLHELFGLRNRVGFTSILVGEESAMSVLQVVPGEPNLAVLSAGPPAPNPSELLGSTRAWTAISALTDQADLVLIDSPPVLPVSDALVVSGLVNATIVVANSGSTTRKSMRRALELLRQVDAPLIGTVLNNAEPVSSSGYAPYETPTPPPTNGSSGSHAPAKAKATPDSNGTAYTKAPRTV